VSGLMFVFVKPLEAEIEELSGATAMSVIDFGQEE
jgi:hypothetical protein